MGKIREKLVTDHGKRFAGATTGQQNRLAGQDGTSAMDTNRRSYWRSHEFGLKRITKHPGLSGPSQPHCGHSAKDNYGPPRYATNPQAAFRQQPALDRRSALRPLQTLETLGTLPNGRSALQMMAALLGLIAAGTAKAESPCAGNIGKFQPPHGVIASATTAQEVASAYLKPIYGENVLAREMPLRATLSNGVWTVVGSPPKQRGNFVGGLAEIRLCQRIGRVLSIIHYK